MGFGGAGFTPIGSAASATGYNIGTTVRTADVFLKQWYYDKGQLNSLMYADDEVLMMLSRLPASEVIEGREMVVPIRIGRSPSQSKDFTKAQDQAKKRTGARGRWIIPIDSDYGVARIENKLIKSSKSKMGAFIKLLADETDNAIIGLKQKRCAALFAPEYSNTNAQNVIGKVRSVSGGGVSCVLTDFGNSANFDIGDSIQAIQPAGTLRGAVVQVDAINRQTGTITFSGAIAGLAANDLLLRDGDRGAVGLTSFLQWLPKQAAGAISGSATLHGLDRSKDVSRLAGFYQELGDAKANATPFTFAVRTMIARIIQLTGSAPTHFICNTLVENFIAAEQTSNIRLDVSGGGAVELTQIGMGKLAFKHSKGLTRIITSSFCPVADCFLINAGSWSLMYLGDQGDDFVDFVRNERGGVITQAYDAPGVEIRVESFGNLVCDGPGKNGRISLNSALVTRVQGAASAFNA